MHRNGKKCRFAPCNSGFSRKICAKTPRGTLPVNSSGGMLPHLPVFGTHQPYHMAAWLKFLEILYVHDKDSGTAHLHIHRNRHIDGRAAVSGHGWWCVNQLFSCT